MHSKRRLGENIAALNIVQILRYAAPLLTVSELVRMLQPVHFGLVSFAQGLVISFRVVTDYGFDFGATRAIAQIFAVSFLCVLGTTLYPVWLFQDTQESKLAAIAFCAACLITIPAIFLFVHRLKDCVIAGGIQAGAELIANAIAMPVIWRRIRVTRHRPSLTDIANCIRQGWALSLSGSALYLLQSSTTVILGFVGGAAMLAVTVALLIVAAMVLVLRNRGLSIWRESARLRVWQARSV